MRELILRWARLMFGEEGAAAAAVVTAKAPRVYLAGPMSGIEALNFPAFHKAAASLRASGYDVVNPAEINSDPNAGWNACMRADIAQLVTCDRIALLPGWEKSKGARLEKHIATELGMREIFVGHFTASAEKERA